MNEKLLQYLWNYKIFKNFEFIDEEGNPVEILDFGKWNHNSGPDFLFAKIKTNNIIFSGHIELHVQASDWILHNHSINTEYDNVILHVVYNNNLQFSDLQKRQVPTIEIREHIDQSLLQKYSQICNDKNFIPCEDLLQPEHIPFNFWENSITKKLDEKANEYVKLLNITKNNHEASLFIFLAYGFGLKVNAVLFRQIAENIDFSVLNKVKQNRYSLEALLLGYANLLENPRDDYHLKLSKEFDFLRTKFNLQNSGVNVKFSKLRPPNFPTIRLSQLANLYYTRQNIYSKVIEAKNIYDLSALFQDIAASEYWDNHFVFGKISPTNSKKTLSHEFINLLLLNVILPFKYAVHRFQQDDAADEILDLYRQLTPEKNAIVASWKSLNIEAKDSLESQALIYHYKNFCAEKNCLNCSIGYRILNYERT